MTIEFVEKKKTIQFFWDGEYDRQKVEDRVLEVLKAHSIDPFGRRVWYERFKREDLAGEPYAIMVWWEDLP